MNIANHVDFLFKNLNNGLNPITGDQFVLGLDPIELQKRIARAALRARGWFAQHGPADLQPLPLSERERMPLKNGGAMHLLALYANSLDSFGYDYKRHPSFDDYARGLMARDDAAWFTSETFKWRIPGRRLETFEELQRRFPPRVLPGLTERDGYSWTPVGRPPRRPRRAT